VHYVEPFVERISEPGSPQLSRADFELFLDSSSPLYLLQGEPGMGKSTFVQARAWELMLKVREAVAAWRSRRLLNLLWARLLPQQQQPALLRIPVILELMHYRVGDLPRLIPNYLRYIGVSDVDVASLREGRFGSVQLVVFCDGFDELQGDNPFDSVVRNLSDTVLGQSEAPWKHGTVKVIVTSRDLRKDSGFERLVFGAAHKRLLLSLSSNQVRYPNQSRGHLSSVQVPVSLAWLALLGTHWRSALCV
jgi:hypothetical protein